MSAAPANLSVVLFDGFELLDVFGPLEVFGALRDHFTITMLGSVAGQVTSAQGPRAHADAAYADAARADIVLVPGGVGTRTLVNDSEFIRWLRSYCREASEVLSVCTGSGVLAAARVLDGYRATSNKRSFEWARSQGPDVVWIREARWVHDRDRWTSSGVAAGIDMALAFVGHHHGERLAQALSDAIEHHRHIDPSSDAFAGLYGAPS